jgi:Protein of unknown function (DUF3237)
MSAAKSGGASGFRTVMRFESAHPSVDWLNRIIAIACGRREKNAVHLDVYEVL